MSQNKPSSYRKLINGIFFVVIVVFAINSCKNRITVSDKISGYRSVTVKYAKHFDLSHENGFTRLSIINPWQKSSGIKYEYYLLKNGNKPPADYDPSKIIRVPVSRVILMSTTYVPMITSIGEGESIKGISGADFVFDTIVRERISEGEIVDVGYEENLNKELIFKLSPDLVIAYGVGSEAAGNMRKLEESGIKILFDADYLEEHPLGRAEWIKVFGALFCHENEADSVFNAVEKEYNEIKSFISKKVEKRPYVMLGLPWKERWFISPGNSYISTIIGDAGGCYLWKDMKADYSVPLGIENVFVQASVADFWLNTGNAYELKDIVSVDKRLEFLKPVRNGKVYNNNNRISEGGGNDYWESGTLYPQKILKDIASILHPEWFPDYKWFYYRKIE